MKKLFPLLLLFVLLTSHELFLKTNTHYLNTNEKAELFLFNGTFDTSENTITRDRIINARVVGPDYNFIPGDNDYYDKGNVTFLKLTTGKAGSYVAGISTLPENIELSGDEFTEYLEHEGLSGTIRDREERGISDKSAVEKYSKHVKALLQVGEKRTKDYSTVLGYPIEFVPLNNPYELKLGDRISFRLFYNGQILPDQVVHVSSRQLKGDTVAGEEQLRTNDKGEVSFTLDNSGQWYIASIYMQKSQEEGLDYESNWATLTFEVR